MVTIKDVAKRAGVSIAAVSYALNGKDGVNTETKEKIEKIAEEMGYIPNSLAKGLLSKKTNILGLVVPDISNVYTSNFIKYLDKYARQYNYYLLLGSTFNEFENEKEIIKSFAAKNVDGLIISPGNYYDESLYEEIVAGIKKRNIPFLFANLSFPNIKSSYVVTDLEEGEYRITRHLMEKGFRDLAFVGGSRSHFYSEVKYMGFLRALSEYGINHGEERYIESGKNYSFDEGYEAVGEYIKKSSLPEAFAAVNDSVAYGIIKALKEKGLKVPEDISVVGFDDISIPTLDTIRLTTVKIPLEEMAAHCLEILGSADGTKVLKHFVLQPELIIGQSVKPGLFSIATSQLS